MTTPQIHIFNNPLVDVNKLPIELVERKGAGHPDTIVDSLGTVISSLYSKYTLQNLDGIAHHNIDKTVISGGHSNPRFGGGSIIRPVQVEFVGRAVREVIEDNHEILTSIPVHQFAKKASKMVFETHIPRIEYEFRTDHIKRGSNDLVTNFAKEQEMPRANDTSFATAWAPLSNLEQLILDIDSFIQDSYRRKNPFVGSDVKVMGRRFNGETIINVAAAFIDQPLENANDYIRERDRLKSTISERFNIPATHLFLNTADKDDEGSFYLTVTGSSLEQGDDGSTGRGNRIMGVIAPFRPQSLEATAGKNPNAHVGNIYNIWAAIIAQNIYEETSIANNVAIVSTIGKPITECDVFISTSEEADRTICQRIVNEVAQDYLNITRKIIDCSFDMYPFNLIPDF